MDKYLPTGDGAPPLGRARDWTYTTAAGTIPHRNEYHAGAGQDQAGIFSGTWTPKIKRPLFSPEAAAYWGAVDLYIGGAETCHRHFVCIFLFAGFWTKFLYDRGLVPIDEPFQKMINQGMIQGRSNFVTGEG